MIGLTADLTLLTFANHFSLLDNQYISCATETVIV